MRDTGEVPRVGVAGEYERIPKGLRPTSQLVKSIINNVLRLSSIAPALLVLPWNRGRFRRVTLVPSVETREVPRIPFLTESRSTQVPIWPDFSRHGTEIVPKIDDRWTSPKPVAVIDAVNHEARLEHERVGDHRIVVGVGVLLDIEVLLNGSLGVR